MKKPKPFSLTAPDEEEGEQDQPQSDEQDEKQRKFQWTPKHRVGYTKQERLA